MLKKIIYITIVIFILSWVYFFSSQNRDLSVQTYEDDYDWWLCNDNGVREQYSSLDKKCSSSTIIQPVWEWTTVCSNWKPDQSFCDLYIDPIVEYTCSQRDGKGFWIESDNFCLQENLTKDSYEKWDIVCSSVYTQPWDSLCMNNNEVWEQIDWICDLTIEWWCKWASEAVWTKLSESCDVNVARYCKWLNWWVDSNTCNFYKACSRKNEKVEIWNINVPFCWNGIIESTRWEECDDWNWQWWDGCSSVCESKDDAKEWSLLLHGHMYWLTHKWIYKEKSQMLLILLYDRIHRKWYEDTSSVLAKASKKIESKIDIFEAKTSKIWLSLKEVVSDLNFISENYQ